MKTLLRLFRFGRRPDAGSPYAEAQYAGWVARPAELRSESASAGPALANSADPEALVARFYYSQEC